MLCFLFAKFMILYENFVKLCCFYDFRPPVSNFMIFYDFMLTGTPTDLFGKTLKRKFFDFFNLDGTFLCHRKAFSLRFIVTQYMIIYILEYRQNTSLYLLAHNLDFECFKYHVNGAYNFVFTSCFH